jgi:transposase InsO family protein
LGSLPQIRPGDVELTTDIRRLVDQRPTYGYRRIAALLKRERRSAGQDPVNVKRVYRLMKKHGLLLERHTGRRSPRDHDGQVIAIRSNIRWCSDALEFTADSDDPGQGFQLKAATIPIEGGQYWPVGTFMGSQRW